MIKKLKKTYKNILKSYFWISDFEGDSSDYDLLQSAVKRLTNPIGSSFEIGIRGGMGSKMIIDAYRKYHPSVNNLIHIGLDPYGDLPYNFSEDRKNQKADYTNLMKRLTIINFLKKYPEFHFVNLDTHEFFKRFDDGYPIYNKQKKIIDKFEIVHFDGLHDLESVSLETEYFLKHLNDQTIFIYDDIDTFDIEKISKKLKSIGFSVLQSKKRKISFEYIKK